MPSALSETGKIMENLYVILILCLFPSVLQLRLNYTNGVNTRIYNIMNTYMLRIHIVSLYYMGV